MDDKTQLSDEIALGFMEVAICLAQALHEADPSVTQRMNFAAGLSYNRLNSEGKQKAAEIVYMFGRSLLNRDLFPATEAGADAEPSEVLA